MTIPLNKPKGTQDVEGIVDAPLHVFEIHVLLLLLVDVQNLSCDVSARCVLIISHVLENGFGEEHEFFCIWISTSFAIGNDHVIASIIRNIAR